MVVRSIIATAFLVRIFFDGTDAVARGGGGFHSGGIGAFQARGFGAAWHGGSFWRGRAAHDFRFHAFDSHQGGSHGPTQHHPDGRFAHENDGHWHQTPNFGKGWHKASDIAGSWHRSPSFGDTRHSGSHGDGEWHIE